MDPNLEPEGRPATLPVGRRGAAIGATVGALLVGGALAVPSLGGTPVTLAASSTASPAPAASVAAGSTNHGFGGPNHEAVSDTSVAAKAIGITESELLTDLQNGQTMAQVAKAKGVDVQKVIDALVADANSEIATAVQNGQMTQAQADAEKAEVTQRVTDQVNGTFAVNGTFMGGRGHGFGGPGDHDGASSTN